MTPHRPTDRAEEARRLFDALVDLPPNERAERLATLNDEPLRREVTSLLDAFDQPEAPIAALDELHALLAHSASADPHRLVGRRVRQYEITEHLGGGGMGVVYKARDTQLDRPVALKFLPPHLAASADAQERFVREAKAASALDHPHIATVYEIGRTEENRRFIAMAYYDGDTLKAILNRGPLPVDTAASYALQIAEALARAHEAGIIHRDVKPANVMVTKHDAVKLVDFGLARVADQSQLTRTGARMGTAAYMSPEQARGETVDARTDLWALGVLFYEMLTGVRPFQGGHETAIVHAILHDAPVPLSERRDDVPPALQTIVEHCLQKEPDRRYASATALLADLRPRSADAGTSSNAPPAVPSSSSRISSALVGAGWRTGAAALLLALLVAASWALWPTSPGDNASPSAVPARSVAVLPFTHLGAADGTDYFSLGITEDILGRLAQVSALSVISRTSVMQYRQTDKSLREIGAELGVATVVEGSVQQVGDRVRIQAQLIDAATDRHLWAESYNRKLEDILAVQSEVATRIAGALQAELLPQERAQLTTRREVDETAYHLYLRAQHLRNRRDSVGVTRAAALFREAVHHDSTFAPAYGGLAMTAFWRGLFRWMPRDTAEGTGLQAADRALALDTTIVEAHLAKALIYQLFTREWTRSEQSFQQALRVNPNHSETRSEYGWMLLRLGHTDRALDQARRAVAVDPRSWLAHHSLGYALYCNRRYERAMRELQTARELGSRLWFTKAYLLHALLKHSRRQVQQGKIDEAETHLTRLADMYPEKDPDRLHDLKDAVKGRQERVLERLDQGERPDREKLTLLLLIGDTEHSLSLIDQLMSFDSEVYADPLFDPVRADPRFEQIVERKLRHEVDLP